MRLCCPSSADDDTESTVAVIYWTNNSTIVQHIYMDQSLACSKKDRLFTVPQVVMIVKCRSSNQFVRIHHDSVACIKTINRRTTDSNDQDKLQSRIQEPPWKQPFSMVQIIHIYQNPLN